MDVTQFAWPLEPSATSAIAAGNASTAGSAADEEVDTLISVVMWGCVAAQCATSFLGWKTITNRASELFQYLWGFGMMYSMAMFFSGVTGAEHNDAWVDVRFISYNVLTYGTAYLTLPKAIDNVVGQEVGEISDLARGAVEIVTQLIVIVGTSFVVGGHGWFSHDILEHLPIALFGITNTVNAVVGDRYSQLNGKLSRTDRIGAALASYAAYTLLKSYSEGGVEPWICMVAQVLALHATYIVSVDAVSSSGAGLRDTAIPMVPMLTDDNVKRSVGDSGASRAAADVKNKVDLGFTKP